MTTLIRGGTVVSATGSSLQDVLVDGETIAALLAPGSVLAASIAAAPGTDTVIDATGKYVIPGGIDGHTHMEMPFGGTQASDTFETGTRAAAWGGTTTIIDFVVQTHGQRVQDQVALWHTKAAGNCAIDYGFHQIIGEVTDDSLKAMDELIGDGITSFKLFMAYPGVFLSTDGQIVQAMQAAAGNGGLIMMHCENGSAIDVLVQQALARGETAPYYHGMTRPWQAEQEATHRAVMLAHLTGAPLYVVHVSAKQALARIAEARRDGQNVFGETCPQYLYLSLEEQLGAQGPQWGNFEGAKWVCSTPLRARAEGHQDELWRYLRTGDVTTVSTDHCPFCMKDQKELGIGDFSKIPNGIGSVEHRMDLLYQGVADGRISLERWVDVCCTTPARMFGLYGRKGVLAPGADADIVVYDPHGHTTIGLGTDAGGRPTGREHHMNMDYSAWEGFEVDGHVDVVLSRGVVIKDATGYVGTKGHGRFLPRELSQNLI
ncbi:MAG TPA: dihydropyrimidinase [Jatrophihabitantaceae bacterium]|jgi:dihydropyrimidinase